MGIVLVHFVRRIEKDRLTLVPLLIDLYPEFVHKSSNIGLGLLIANPLAADFEQRAVRELRRPCPTANARTGLEHGDGVPGLMHAVSGGQAGISRAHHAEIRVDSGHRSTPG